MTVTEKLDLIKTGFESLKVEDEYKKSALNYLEKWLTEEQFQDYVPQIDYLIEQKNWDLLLDAFYQVIPFGTAGRRGLVGIGPNRINIWTMQSSTQGHSQYLIAKYKDEAKSRGVVITYDVRQYLDKTDYDDNRLNPIKDLDCKTLAMKQAEVYAANGIKVYFFDNYTPTPQLSFTIRYLHAVGGTMISASHNPPEHNGQKVMEANGGQLIPPEDQFLVDTVVKDVKEIKEMDFEKAKEQGLVVVVSNEVKQAYVEAASKTSLNGNYRSAKVYFSPFHGTSYKTFPAVFRNLGFDIVSDEISSMPDPGFSSITFNIPNPEVLESFKNLLNPATENNADIILVNDPDADRIGVMSYEQDHWQFYTGNEIAVLAVSYILSELKEQEKLKSSNVVAKTLVTTNFIKILTDSFGVESVTDLLVGIKYVAVLMDELESQGRINDFLIGVEESNGSSGGKNYVRDKDALIPGILIAELASKLKDEGKTLGQYLDELYEKYGYMLNYLTEIRLPGAEGMSSIAKIQNHFRSVKPSKIGEFEVDEYIDRLDGSKILSATDRDSRNLLVLKFKLPENLIQLQAVVRPSGTEPKLKFYVEVGVNANAVRSLKEQKLLAEKYKQSLEKDLLKYSYKILGIDFPDRAFLLFWQLPAMTKIKYFEIENEIVNLKKLEDVSERKTKLYELLAFLGNDPVEKMNEAFKAEYGEGVLDYLNIKR